jgi:peroxiredoxin family protein
MTRIVILGAGTAGTIMANRLRRLYARDVRSARTTITAKLYACKASVEMFGLTREDFIEELEGIITVGDFYQLAAGGEIIFT